MKVSVVFSALLAVSSASSLYLARLAPAISSQYHSQDGIGQYAYGYNDHLSNKQEVKSLDGSTRGAYSYIDSNNVLQTVNYVADAGGFRVSGTNLPKPVEVPAQDLPKQIPDTLEVAAAKSAHFAVVEEAKQRLGVQQRVSILTGDLQQQVQDTPEVAKAKAEHFAAIQAAKNQISYQILAVPAPLQLPQQVVDTPEEHFAAIEAAKNQIGYQVLAVPAPIGLPQPVQDTPEVAKAKAEHLLAIEQAKLQNSISNIRYTGYSLVQSAPLVASPIQLSASSSGPLPSHGFAYSSSVVNEPYPASLNVNAPYYRIVL